MNLKPLLHTILQDYSLPISGCHGVAHWARVLENGRFLCEQNGADIDVVSLFALLHDSRRISETTDPDHGLRAAEYAKRIRGFDFQLDDKAFHLLYRACEGHTHERTHSNLTIQTCWDSDRLDLGRVGVTPDPSRLCTELAKKPETINWADGRGSMGVVPDFVLEDWGIDLQEERGW